jgi:hypothetical protein
LNLGPHKCKADVIPTGTKHLVLKHTVAEITVPNIQNQKDHVHRMGEDGWLKETSVKEDMLKRLLRLTVYCMKTQNIELKVVTHWNQCYNTNSQET